MALQQTTANLKEAVQSTQEEVQVVRNELAEITSALSSLARLEGQLAKAEMDEARGHAIRGGAMGIASFILAELAAIFLFLTLMFVLDEFMPLWAAALMTTLLIAVIAAVLLTLTRTELKAFSPVPRRFLGSVREDFKWAKMQLKSNVQ